MKKSGSFNRRNFLRSGVTVAAGAMLAGKVTATENSNADKKIITRRLGKTGIELPIVSMGVMRADNPSLVKAALAKGVVLLDTAHGYQNGNNELMLGEVLKDYPRNSFVIATKIHPEKIEKETGVFSSFDAGKFLDMLDTSLNRLQMDYVDILYLHGMDSPEAVLHKPLLDVLDQIRKEGKARFLGISTHRNMAKIFDAAVESKFYDVVLSSYNFQLKDDQVLQEAIVNASKAGIGIIAMKTMAGGFFDKERQKPVNSKAALKWALQNENIHTSIPGYTNFEQLEDSFSVMENPVLNEEEIKSLRLDELTQSLFCSGCETCTTKCRKGLSVPDLMRAYMYTYGYHDYFHAQQVLASNLPDKNPCDSCEICTVECLKGFDVAMRIKDVSRLRSVPDEFFT